MPLFAFSSQVEDDGAGNGDGLVQRGEEITLRVDVKNEGAGPSGDKTFVAIKRKQPWEQPRARKCSAP